MKYGIIGLGNHAINRVMPSIISSGSEILGITTTNSGKGNTVSDQHSCKYFSTYDEMLRSDIESVYIGSPNFLHYEHAMKAIRNGKNVLMEKPMTLRAVEAKDIMELAKEKKVRVAVGFHLRMHPAISVVKKRLSETQVSIKLISGYWGHMSTSHLNITDDTRWWGEYEKSGGGSVMGTGVHVIDTILNIAGKFPRKVTAFALPEGSMIDRSMLVNMQFENFIGTAYSSRETSALRNDLVVVTEGEEIRVKNFFSTSIDYEILVNGSSLQKESGGNIYEKEIIEFEKAVSGEESHIARDRDGYYVVRVIDDAHRYLSMAR